MTSLIEHSPWRRHAAAAGRDRTLQRRDIRCSMHALGNSHVGEVLQMHCSANVRGARGLQAVGLRCVARPVYAVHGDCRPKACDASLGLYTRCTGKTRRRRVLRCSGGVCFARGLQAVGLRCVARPVYAVHGEQSAEGACCVARGRQAEGLLSVARAVFALRGNCRM